MVGGTQHWKETTGALERMLCCVHLGASVAGAPGPFLVLAGTLAPPATRGRGRGRRESASFSRAGVGGSAKPAGGRSLRRLSSSELYFHCGASSF